MLAAFEIIVAKGEAGSSIGEVEQAEAHVKRLRAKQRTAQREQDEAELSDLSRMVRPYFEVRAKDPVNLFRRVKLAEWDDVYASGRSGWRWLMGTAPRFVQMGNLALPVGCGRGTHLPCSARCHTSGS